MTTQPDFEELLGFLEKNNVRYMIIGGSGRTQDKADVEHLE